MNVLQYFFMFTAHGKKYHQTTAELLSDSESKHRSKHHYRSLCGMLDSHNQNTFQVFYPCGTVPKDKQACKKCFKG